MQVGEDIEYHGDVPFGDAGVSCESMRFCKWKALPTLRDSTVACKVNTQQRNQANGRVVAPAGGSTPVQVQ
jgi:hypothetical protein